jgi:hypothetical protein
MITKSEFKLIAILIFLAISAYGQEKLPGSKLEISREIVFETKPACAPYYMPISLFWLTGVDFAPTENIDSIKAIHNKTSSSRIQPPTTGYFWALNNDELAFINRRLGRVFVLDLRTGIYRDFDLKVGNYDRLSLLWVGPEDDIYAALSPSGRNQPPGVFETTDSVRLFRFERMNEIYLYDDISHFESYGRLPYRMRISPLNDLYVSGWSPKKLPGSGNLVISKYGMELRLTRADGENLNGDEFKITSMYDRDYQVVKVANLKTGKFFMIEEIQGDSFRSNYKYCFNNNLIFYWHNFIDTGMDNGRILMVNRPSIFGTDINSGYHYLIDADALAREGYGCYTVSDVSINYNGDIYAIVIYFNSPGMITGDELIILYRWRL